MVSTSSTNEGTSSTNEMSDLLNRALVHFLGDLR